MPAEFKEFVNRVIQERHKNYIDQRQLTITMLPEFAEKLSQTKLISRNLL